MSDVTVYLDNIKRDGNIFIYPAGIFSSKCPNRQPQKIDLTGGGYERLRRIITHALSKSSDALTADEASAVTGYSKSLILKAIQSGNLYAENVSAHYIIPKENLVGFLA